MESTHSIPASPSRADAADAIVTSDILDGYLILHSGDLPPLDALAARGVRVVLDCGAAPTGSPPTTEGASKGGGAANDADVPAPRGIAVHRLNLTSAPPATTVAAATSAAATTTAAAAGSATAGGASTRSLPTVAFLRIAHTLLDEVRQRDGTQRVLVTASAMVGPELPFVIGAAHLMMRSGPFKHTSLDDAVRRAASVLPSAQPNAVLRKLLADVAKTSTMFGTAAFGEASADGPDPNRAGGGGSSSSSSSDSGGGGSGHVTPTVSAAGVRLKQLIADINGTCTGKPYHSLPLLPVDGETGAPCGFYDNTQQVWYSRQQLSQNFLVFLKGKGYDTDAIAALALRWMPPQHSGGEEKQHGEPAENLSAWAIECLFSQYTVLAYVAGLALEPPMEKAQPDESVDATAQRCCEEEAGVPGCTEFVRMGGILGRDGKINVLMAPQSEAWRAKFTEGGAQSVNPHGLPAMWLCVPNVQKLRSRAQKSTMECCSLGMRTLNQLRTEAGHPFCHMVTSYAAIARGDFDAQDNLVAPQDLAKYQHNGVTLYFADAEGNVATQRSDRLRKHIGNIGNIGDSLGVGGSTNAVDK